MTQSLSRGFRLLLLVFAAACSSGGISGEDLRTQEAKTEAASVLLDRERFALAALRDSLDAHVAASVALGTAPEKAREEEDARIRVQEAVVTAAERNHAAQSEVLALMRRLSAP